MFALSPRLRSAVKLQGRPQSENGSKGASREQLLWKVPGRVAEDVLEGDIGQIYMTYFGESISSSLLPRPGG